VLWGDPNGFDVEVEAASEPAPTEFGIAAVLLSNWLVVTALVPVPDNKLVLTVEVADVDEPNELPVPIKTLAPN